MHHLNITRTWGSNNCAANAWLCISCSISIPMLSCAYLYWNLFTILREQHEVWGVTALDKHLGLLQLPFQNFPTVGGRNVNICLHLVIYLKKHFYLYLKSNNLVLLLGEMLMCFFCSFVSKISFLLACILWWQIILGFFFIVFDVSLNLFPCFLLNCFPYLGHSVLLRHNVMFFLHQSSLHFIFKLILVIYRHYWEVTKQWEESRWDFPSFMSVWLHLPVSSSDIFYSVENDN